MESVINHAQVGNLSRDLPARKLVNQFPNAKSSLMTDNSNLITTNEGIQIIGLESKYEVAQPKFILNTSQSQLVTTQPLPYTRQVSTVE